jgi:hypothetical protein
MMNRHERRKANAEGRKFRKPTAEERKFFSPNCRVEEVNLDDPNVAAEHRDNVINAVRLKVAALDELIGRWYRHFDECQIEGCDHGAVELIEQVSALCKHLVFIKKAYGEAVVDEGSYVVRFIDECWGQETRRRHIGVKANPTSVDRLQ